MPVTFERAGGSRPRVLLPPVAKASTNPDGFRKMAPEGLRSRIHELLDEVSMSEYNSPAADRSPNADGGVTMTPMRAYQRKGWKSSMDLNSREGAELVSVEKSLQRWKDARAVNFGSVAASPAAGASPVRTRSLGRTFGWAGPDAHRFIHASSPRGAALRHEVAGASPKPAGAKSLKPLRERHAGVTKGRELPSGLRKWSRDELVVRAPPPPISLSLPGSQRCGAPSSRARSAPRWGALYRGRLF